MADPEEEDEILVSYKSCSMAGMDGVCIHYSGVLCFLVKYDILGFILNVCKVKAQSLVICVYMLIVRDGFPQCKCCSMCAHVNLGSDEGFF